MLAGGTGSRLWPITHGVSKQLLPIYDKPMIFYPISTLMLAGIREILIITTPHDQSQFKTVLGDGSEYGVTFQYATQHKPAGLAQAFTIGQEFLGEDNCLLILGDNLFHGAGLGRDLLRSLPRSGCHLFLFEVSNPSDYGILQLSSSHQPEKVVEKPKDFISNLAITGLYFFDNNVSRVASGVTPSERGEMEITEVIQDYLVNKTLTYTKLSRGSTWLDTGNPDSLLDAASYVQIIEKRTGLKIACLEEIAFSNGWITIDQLKESVTKYSSGTYGKYLKQILSEE